MSIVRVMRRSQVSLEFMFVFAIITVLLVYSVNNTTFKQGSASVDTLKIQMALEEKNLASVISNTIDQVYSQGPGSKATSYAQISYLRNPAYLEKAWGVKDPRIFITYAPFENKGYVTYVMVINGSDVTTVAFNGTNRDIFWGWTMYHGGLLLYNSSVWVTTDSSLGTSAKLKTADSSTVSTIYGLVLPPSVGPRIKIVVEWNPDLPNRWLFNETASEIRININPGG